jgi:hypothetical protein
LSELLIQKIKYQIRYSINCIETNESIKNYLDTVKLPEAREGALVLKKSIRLPRATATRNQSY